MRHLDNILEKNALKNNHPVVINTETGVKVENITYEHFQVIKKLKVF